MFKTFLSYYKPYKSILLFLVIGSLLRALLELFFPYVVKLMLEQQLPLKNLPLLLKWSAALLTMYLVNFGMHFGIIYWAQSMSYSMERTCAAICSAICKSCPLAFTIKTKAASCFRASQAI